MVGVSKELKRIARRRRLLRQLGGAAIIVVWLSWLGAWPAMFLIPIDSLEDSAALRVLNMAVLVWFLVGWAVAVVTTWLFFGAQPSDF